MWESSEADLQVLQGVFVRAAKEFGCQTVDGVRAEGWRGRTLGGKVTANGLARRLRVVVATRSVPAANTFSSTPARPVHQESGSWRPCWRVGSSDKTGSSTRADSSGTINDGVVHALGLWPQEQFWVQCPVVGVEDIAA
jgi:hypothetical protein